MSIFKKIASAFVEFQPGTGAGRGAAAEPVPTASDIEAELAALEGQPTMAGEVGAGPTPLAPPPDPTIPAETAALLGMTAEQVFVEAGLIDSQTSAPRILKMLFGLAQFPAAQQLAMLRVMDSADDSWSEAEVTDDAQRRQQTLEAHVVRIEHTRKARMVALDQQAAQTQETRVATLAEVDRQIAELMKLREQAITECAQAAAGIDREKRELDQASEQARTRILGTAQQLGSLIAFFTAGGPPPR